MSPHRCAMCNTTPVVPCCPGDTAAVYAIVARCRDGGGRPLGLAARVTLFELIETPGPATWQQAHTIIINTAGLTLWQATRPLLRRPPALHGSRAAGGAGVAPTPADTLAHWGTTPSAAVILMALSAGAPADATLPPHPCADLPTAEAHAIGSLLVHAARQLRTSGHQRRPCPRGAARCPATGRAARCTPCAIDRAVEAHTGEPHDPVTAYHDTWLLWRNRGAYAKVVAAITARPKEPVAALAATAHTISTGRTHP